MSACLSKSFRLSSTLKIEEEAMATKNQGIGSILGSDCERTKSSTLRRTLSADMSSTKWLTQHGFSPIKKIASSKEFSISSITDSEEEGEAEKDNEDKETETETEAEQQSQFDFWSSIQEEMYKKKELEKPGQFDIWSSIISEKAQYLSNKPVPAPYIHPLVKRSASSLSKKSLEICTESLGSETGSDGFSSYPSSETSDTDDDKEIEQEQPLQQQEEERMAESFDVEEMTVPKYNYVVGKKSPQRSFPPPISSLSRHDGASIRMQSRRDNGRLVLEAVSVPCTNNFRAQRQDGRLVLTFVNKFSTYEEAVTTEDEDGDEDKEVEIFDDEEEEEEKGEEETEEEEMEESENENRGSEMEIEFVMDEQAPKLLSEVINVHRLTPVMNKHLGFAKTNPSWPNKFNEVVKFDEVEDTKPPTSSLLAQSLPPSPTMARLIPKPPATAAATVSSGGGATFNSYEYFWRPNPLTSGPGPVSKQMKNQQRQQINSKLIVSKKMNSVENEQQQVVFLSENKGDYLVPLSKGCKEPRRSLLFWEPYCIATS